MSRPSARPKGRNARRVLVIMSTILGFLVLGVSLLAHITHAVPYLHGTPTVLSQEAQYVFGSAWFGKFGFFFVQGATMLILYTGANTSFNGFPNLASFVAEDAFLPRRLTRRGHRLVFSNGIIILTIAAEALLIGTNAQVSVLVGVYAVGVFTGFTMAGAGMAKHHLRMREKGWKYKLAINGFAAVLSLSVVLIFVIVKFREGVWIVVVLFIILVPTLIRLHKQYDEERSELEENVSNALVAPILRRHVVLVFVDRLDLADARALQYARMLDPDELRAVHFVLDSTRAAELEAQWAKLGLSRFPLDLVECPDRRLVRASMELIADVAADGQTEVSVLLPHRVVSGYWQRLLHDRTSDRIAAYVGELPNVNATIVPFQLGKRRRQLVPWKVGGDKGSGALHDAEFGTNEPSRAARRSRCQDGGRARRRLPQRLHVGPRRRGDPDRRPAPASACPGRRAHPDCACAAPSRSFLARMHDLRWERPGHGRVPRSSPRGWYRARSPRRRRGHGRISRTQRRDGQPALLGDLDPGSRRGPDGRLRGRRPGQS